LVFISYITVQADPHLAESVILFLSPVGSTLQRVLEAQSNGQRTSILFAKTLPVTAQQRDVVVSSRCYISVNCK